MEDVISNLSFDRRVSKCLPDALRRVVIKLVWGEKRGVEKKLIFSQRILRAERKEIIYKDIVVKVSAILA